mmetsp:Transcript_105121/g.177559  ORF Transcript_105121/g.177559 Transcript_105121/m.177559 type:complete len:223 (-) Transcript_105121:103-771(-)
MRWQGAGHQIERQRRQVHGPISGCGDPSSQRTFVCRGVHREGVHRLLDLSLHVEHVLLRPFGAPALHLGDQPAPALQVGKPRRPPQHSQQQHVPRVIGQLLNVGALGDEGIQALLVGHAAFIQDLVRAQGHVPPLVGQLHDEALDAPVADLVPHAHLRLEAVPKLERGEVPNGLRPMLHGVLQDGGRVAVEPGVVHPPEIDELENLVAQIIAIAVRLCQRIQ